ncbi:fungal hydrophobin [Schizopora paradoxa]|uniref:Hydrophobin n=1 Tax=Schizopora paradoxa TaxID=27342 RepID=A0A0H2RV69_9AGAM|nr:fungal hydrophobin [Schizopora paradoxa]
MLFSKFTGIAILAVATTSFAQSCCNSVTSSSDPATALLLGLLGVVVQGVDIPIGIGCSPITVVGVSGTSCTSDPVNCSDIVTEQLIGIDCTPVNVGA